MSGDQICFFPTKLLEKICTNFWWSCSRAGKVFTKMIANMAQKGGLVNSIHELWQTIHEQCSSKSLKKVFGDQCSRTLANCSRIVFTKKPKKRVWWTLFKNFCKLFTNNVHKKVQKGEHCSRTLANCSRTMFTKKCQKGVWGTLLTNFGKLMFTNNVHQNRYVIT